MTYNNRIIINNNITKDLKYILGLLLYMFFILSIFPQNNISNNEIKKDTTVDLSFVDKYDSLYVSHFQQLLRFNYRADSSNNEGNYNYMIDDEILETRIKHLRNQTPFDFRFNEATKAMINLYANKRKNLTSKMLTYKELYLPLFEKYLIEYNLPIELRYLPIIESALNPKARSRAGAGGLWQFMPRTGNAYGLSISSYIDERCDPYLSTEAACKYLSLLHKIYDDWNLVLAAYNCGMGNVNKAIRRANGATTYWEIRHLLPKETQNYVPAFTAVNYIMKYYNSHNIKPNKVEFLNENIDTLHVCKRIEFDVLEEWLGYEQHKIRYLNPMFINHVIPSTNNYYSLYLPRELIGDFIQLEDSIYKYSSFKYKDYIAQNKLKRVQYMHTIKHTETLSSIAKKYNCKEEDIKAWNNRTSNRLRVGKRLLVFKEVSYTKDNNVNTSEINKGYNIQDTITYTVKRGDTLWDIAQKYRGISVNDIKFANNNMSSRLKSGQKIKIPIR